ncbi:MAG: glycosyltransferase family 2 protein [Candidatus Berkelbacteria bacterium]|nr:glycosyltransferase family 2 protein [Candidatus Berkelbacteria bacterium]
MKKTRLWRFLEIFPGALVWTGLITPVVLSFIWPTAVAIYILIFDIYWVFNALVMAYFTATSYRRMKKAQHTDFGRVLESLPQDDPLILDYNKVFQVVIFATFREEIETLLPSVESVTEAKWENKRQIIVLAGEERDRERLYRNGELLKQKFSNQLFDFIIVEHPDGILGEVRGKGAGCHFAGEKLTEYCLQKGIDEANVLVTVADADTRFQKQYFNAIANEFCINPNRHRRTYQPIPLYANNIWQAHPIPRLVAWGSSFWQMIEASRPWRMINFSTHSYSLKMLHEMDYWAVDVVNEDSRQFWRAYYAFDGDHQVVPIYLPVYMDAVFADDLKTTLVNQYLQKRRWAYGIEHFPYIITNAIQNKKVPIWDETFRILRLLKGTYDWSTASFYLLIVGWLPLIFSSSFRNTVLAVNIPFLTRFLLPIAWIGTVLSAYISLSFLPPRPENVKKSKYIYMILEWLIVPVTAILWGSLPALESQTRLMLGKYLTFWVTPKTVKK